MHHSRFCTVIIDCQTSVLATAAQFWSQAFGRPTVSGNPENTNYVGLDMRSKEITCEVQAVSHERRVHLDIETDDTEAKRLTALGAKEVERIKTWVVMQAPTGQRFCVVRPHRARHRHLSPEA